MKRFLLHHLDHDCCKTVKNNRFVSRQRKCECHTEECRSEKEIPRIPIPVVQPLYIVKEKKKARRVVNYKQKQIKLQRPSTLNLNKKEKVDIIRRQLLAEMNWKTKKESVVIERASKEEKSVKTTKRSDKLSKMEISKLIRKDLLKNSIRDSQTINSYQTNSICRQKSDSFSKTKKNDRDSFRDFISFEKEKLMSLKKSVRKTPEESNRTFEYHTPMKLSQFGKSLIIDDIYHFSRWPSKNENEKKISTFKIEISKDIHKPTQNNFEIIDGPLLTFKKQEKEEDSTQKLVHTSSSKRCFIGDSAKKDIPTNIETINFNHLFKAHKSILKNSDEHTPKTRNRVRFIEKESEEEDNKTKSLNRTLQNPKKRRSVSFLKSHNKSVDFTQQDLRPRSKTEKKIDFFVPKEETIKGGYISTLPRRLTDFSSLMDIENVPKIKRSTIRSSFKIA